MKFKMMKKKEGEILFDFYTVPNAKNKDEMIYCVRPVIQRTVTANDLATRIEKECTLTRADVKAVIEALSNHIANCLANGERVHLPNLGYFNLKLKSDVKIDPNKTKANHISYDTTGFTPDKGFNNQLINMAFRRCPLMHGKYPTKEKIVEKLKQFFDSGKTSFVRAHIEAAFGVSRSTAHRIIKDLLQSGKIVNENTKRNPIYVKGPNF
ncbi:MAG: HU family DNA-binding protein [Phocaeicola sp.]|uniref:HU family DNA-binding protein n=1 Tax=Phocaeicola TaxID=909656 RepID=UPI00234EAAFA|nr:HU family DNA-binding protein [Phocaeicola oris]MCE2615423.1 HU family DNA-binding protein [Phocaeicola oris]